MKLLTALFVIFTIIANTSFSKSGDAYSHSKEKAVNDLLNKKDHIADTQIKPFDFPKLFSEAETYFNAAKAWEKLKCEPKSGFICTKRECPKRESDAFLILDKKKKLVTRCEKDVCESFKAEFDQTGVFFNIKAKGPIGTLIRILGDSRYKEITTVGLDAYIANGNCEVYMDK